MSDFFYACGCCFQPSVEVAGLSAGVDLAAGVAAGFAAGAAADFDSFAAGALTGAGAALLGAGAVAGVMLDTFNGAFTVNDAQMESTQMKTARLHVAFSMKSVVLR